MEFYLKRNRRSNLCLVVDIELWLLSWAQGVQLKTIKRNCKR